MSIWRYRTENIWKIRENCEYDRTTQTGRIEPLN